MRVLFRPLSLVLACTLACAPVAGWAHGYRPGQSASELPRLGSAGGDELTPGAERRLGETIMRDLRRDGTVSDDVEVTDWLVGFATALESTPAAAGLELDFFLVKEASINAFALPGGFIGVHSGLVVAAQTESQLASVLAHEIGHVAQRHIARMLVQQKQTSMLALAGLVLGALAARGAGAGGDAIAGLATLGSSVAQQQMLSFSRDAEREADRIGLDMLRQAGFDPNGAAEFFERLQSANRVRETNAPAYLRTHPVTSERIADMQSRISSLRYRQRADSLDFRLVRARLRAGQDQGVDGLAAARRHFTDLQKAGDQADPVPWFGLAQVALSQRDFPAVRRALDEARRRLPASHPFVERLQAEGLLAAGDTAGALATSREAVARFPDARALAHWHARALQATGDARGAADFLRERLQVFRGDGQLWRQLAEAHSALDETALAHRASAEAFVLAGALPAAIEQLERAQRAGGVDFVTASTLDARVRQLREQHAAEMREQQAQRR